MKQQVDTELTLAVQLKKDLFRRQIVDKKREQVKVLFTYINHVVSEIERSIGILQNWRPMPIDQIMESVEKNRNQS